jgi:hypothetical protein
MSLQHDTDCIASLPNDILIHGIFEFFYDIDLFVLGHVSRSSEKQIKAMRSRFELKMVAFESIAIAIKYKSTRFLMWLKEMGIHPPEKSLSLAALLGTVEIMEWLFTDNGFTPSRSDLLDACVSGAIDRVEWLFRHMTIEEDLVDLRRNMVTNAIYSGNVDLLEYLKKKGFVLDEIHMSVAINTKRTHVMEWVWASADEKIRQDIDIPSLVGEVDDGDLSTYQWLHSKKLLDVSAFIDLFDTAFEHGYVEVVDWIWNLDEIRDFRGPEQPELQWEERRRAFFRVDVSIEMMKWAHEHGYGMEPYTYYLCGRTTQLIEALDFLYSTGCPIPEEFGSHGTDPCVVRWLYGKGYPLKSDDFIESLIRKDEDQLKWLIANNCPWPTNLMKLPGLHEAVAYFCRPPLVDIQLTPTLYYLLMASGRKDITDWCLNYRQ